MANNTNPGNSSPTDGRGGPGRYSLLMPGNAAYFTPAGDLQQKWKGFCTALLTQIGTIQTRVENTSLDLQRAQTVLHNADTDSLTAADIWLILGDVMPGASSGTNPNLTPPPVTG